MRIKILTFISVDFIENRKEKTLVIGTHNGIFHADEVVAIAILCLLYEDYEIIIVRTRDAETLALCDICVDVGEGKYDHHQRGFDLYRDNNVMYASAGLVWKDFGKRLIKKYLEEYFPNMSSNFSLEIWKEFDERIIIPIDLEDNGKNGIKKDRNSDDKKDKKDENSDDKKESKGENNRNKEHYFSYITTFRPLWNEENMLFDGSFLEVLHVTILILKQQLLNLIANYVVEDFLKDRCRNERYFSDNILEIPSQTTPWLKSIVKFNNEVSEKEIVNFVIFRYPDGGWAAQCVPPSLEEENNQRIPFPEEWAGHTTELAKICKVPGAIRCHNNRFFIRAQTRDAIVKMCKLAVAAWRSEA